MTTDPTPADTRAADIAQTLTATAQECRYRLGGREAPDGHH
jgi:hypothetical protein